MACSFLMKGMVVASKLLVTRSGVGVVPFCPTATATIRRGLSSKAGIITNNEVCTEMSSWMRVGLLNKVPHTLLTTTRVNLFGEVPLTVSDNDNNSMIRSLGEEGRKFSLSIPGTEDVLWAKEGISVTLDLGMKMNDDDFDDQHVEAKSEEKNTVSIKGYVQKHDIRRNYQAVVRLNMEDRPLNITSLFGQKITTKVKDGSLVVTFHWNEKQ